MRRAVSLVVALVAVLGSLALALPATPAPAQESAGPEGGAAVAVSGVLERPEITTYQYGTHAVTDEETGTRYALTSESVNLDAYVGRRVAVTGAVVPGYEAGAVEGGPALLEVTAVVVEPEGTTGGSTGGAPPPGETPQAVTATFRLVLEGEVPEDTSFYVEDSRGIGGVICTTDGAVIEQAGYPECHGGTNELELSVPPGGTYSYRVLTSRGVELSQNVVVEGEVSPDADFTVDAPYAFAGTGGETTGGQAEDQYQYGSTGQYSSTDETRSSTADDGPEEPDLNGDGVANEADGEVAAEISTAASEATATEEDPVLPDTGGAPLPGLIAAAVALLAGGGLLAARRPPR